MDARKVKPGQIVRVAGNGYVSRVPGAAKQPDTSGDWTVLDRTPKPACWWLHRWEGSRWAVVEARATYLEFVADPVRTTL